MRRSLDDKSRKELQALAKANGIKANLSSEKIISALVATKSASVPSPAVPPRSASRGVVRPLHPCSPLSSSWLSGRARTATCSNARYNSDWNGLNINVPFVDFV